jgi:hypothetical protein
MSKHIKLNSKDIIVLLLLAFFIIMALISCTNSTKAYRVFVVHYNKIGIPSGDVDYKLIQGGKVSYFAPEIDSVFHKVAGHRINKDSVKVFDSLSLQYYRYSENDVLMESPKKVPVQDFKLRPIVHVH